MKKYVLLAAVLLGSLNYAQVQAQNSDNANTSNGNPNFSKMDVSPLDVELLRDENEEPLARVLYSRPQKRDRQVFGKLVPHGKVWRTGANESTELTLYEDMMIGNERIEAGTYSIYTIPEEDQWTVIINNSTNRWGAYDYNQEEDVARIQVPVKRSQNSIEAFSMTFDSTDDGGRLYMGWDDRYIELPFEKVD